MEVVPPDLFFFFFLFRSGGDSDHGEPGGSEEGLAVTETSAERRITLNLTRVFQSGVFISRGSDISLTHWRHMGCLLPDSVTRGLSDYALEEAQNIHRTASCLEIF